MPVSLVSFQERESESSKYGASSRRYREKLKALDPDYYRHYQQLGRERMKRVRQRNRQLRSAAARAMTFQCNEDVRRLPLPEFSPHVLQYLLGPDHLPRPIWVKVVQETASFYMEAFPNLIKRNTYQTIGMKIFSCYPVIGSSGCRPWSKFTKSLSQKIRHLRHDRLKVQRNSDNINLDNASM